MVEDFKSKLTENFIKTNSVDPALYSKYEVKRGLRNPDGSGVVTGLTNISNVHGYMVSEGEKYPIEGELVYRGYNINDLVSNAMDEKRFGYEEIVYLLLLGRLPNPQELGIFREIIAENRKLPDSFFEDMILKAPSNNIMNKLSRSILALYSYDDTPELRTPEYEMQTAISVIAKMPTIMVQAYQVKNMVYSGKSMFMHPLRPEESTAQSILSTLRPDREYTDDEARLLDMMLMLHAEHGGGNNSTFTCRCLTSSGTDPYAAYSAAIGSLKGPKHGGANIKVMEMVNCFEENIDDWEDEEEVADFMRKTLRGETNDGSGLIYGMGHAVYTYSDPRAVILKKYALDMAKGTEFEKEFNLLQTVERLTPEIFHEVKGSSKVVCANVDMYSGLVYKMLGIPQDLFTPLFAVARMAGWCAHRFEEMVTGRRIIRPAYKAVMKNKEYIPINER